MCVCVADFTVLTVDLVTDEYDGDVLTYSSQVFVPVRYGLVGDTSGDIKHDDSGLTTDVVAISQST